MIKFGVVFLMLLLGTAGIGAAQPRHSEDVRKLAAGVAANQRLTALTGGPLYVLLAGIAVTILFIQQLLAEHYLIGFLLIPPLALKLVSTGYRFARYYTGNPSYRLAGPPSLLLRFGVAPILVASTLAVFVTGIELWLFGLRFGSGWMTAHTLSSVVFILAAGAHLLAHFRRSADAGLEETRVQPSREAWTRRSLVVGSLLLGAALAAASLLYATPFPPATAGG